MRPGEHRQWSPPEASNRAHDLAVTLAIMDRPKRSRASSAESVAIFPEQLRISDRFTNADGEWEVASRPVTFKQGHEARARIQRPGDPGTARETTWPAFERVKVRRTST